LPMNCHSRWTGRCVTPEIHPAQKRRIASYSNAM
jgi:hypothetical protein